MNREVKLSEDTPLLSLEELEVGETYLDTRDRDVVLVVADGTKGGDGKPKYVVLAGDGGQDWQEHNSPPFLYDYQDSNRYDPARKMFLRVESSFTVTIPPRRNHHED